MLKARKTKFFAVLSAAVACLAAHSPALGSSPERETPVVRAVREASPAVVNISTERTVRTSGLRSTGDPFFDMFFGDFMGPRTRTDRSLGSGVIIDPKGYVLTNEHVILQADRITVTLADGRSFEAKVIGSDSKRDLAVLKVDAPVPLPAIACGTSSDLMIGETVIAIGNPFGLSHTVTTGVLSATGRNIRLQNGRVYYDFLQTDASINPGNSGGALLNVDGELIGITSAVHGQAQGIGFAIPIDKAKLVYEDLVRFGEVHQGWIGLDAADLNENVAEALGMGGRRGVVVSGLSPSGPAERAGIRQGDILVGVGTQAIGDKEGLRHVLSRVAVGEAVSIKLLRDGRPMTVKVTSIEVPTDIVEQICWQRMGMRTAANSPAAARAYNLPTDKGVVVLMVRGGSPAQGLGIEKNDVILMVNRLELKSEDDWRRAVSNLVYADGAILVIGRGGKLYRVALPMAAEE